MSRRLAHPRPRSFGVWVVTACATLACSATDEGASQAPPQNMPGASMPAATATAPVNATVPGSAGSAGSAELTSGTEPAPPTAAGSGTNATEPATNGGSGTTIPIVAEDDQLTVGESAPAIPVEARDPITCAEAEAHRTYVGCEFFPTVVGNVVASEFDYAVVVANASSETAEVTVTSTSGELSRVSVAAHQLATIYLPWVSELKGPDLSDACVADALTGSVVSRGGAYRLTSTRPVAVYQFNPLQFRAMGGPSDKQWSCKPGVSPACQCNSYTNDASLLLPANALTSSYVAHTWHPTSGTEKPVYVAVTATRDDTELTVQVGAFGQLLSSPDAVVPALGPSETFTTVMQARDVVELVAAPGTDLSGTLIQSTEGKPVQVISGSQSANIPNPNTRSADHLEELVFPAETLGKDYVVPVPTGPGGTPIGHVVRLYAHLDTTFVYSPVHPSGAPERLAAGEVGEFQTAQDFQLVGSQPFAVGSFLVGGQLLDPAAPSSDSAGDPSQTFITAVPQYRDRYVFLAPVDYESNYIDIVAPSAATITLDGSPLDAGAGSLLDGIDEQGGSLSYRIHRVRLGGGAGLQGAHELVANQPVGLQVIGYGRFTSYQYPGGLNLDLISPPPPIVAPVR